MQRIAQQFGYGVEPVRLWVKQADIDDGLKAGTTTEDAARIKELEQEDRELAPRQRHLEISFGFLRGGARPPTEAIVDYIDTHRDEFGVEPICKVLQVAPSTYYSAKSRPPSQRSLRDALLIPIMMALWVANYRVYARSDDKKRARLNVITHLLGQVSYEPLPRKRVALPERKIRDASSESAPVLRFIPTPF